MRLPCLGESSRLSATEKGLYYVRYFEDFAAFPEDNIWSDTGIAGFASDKRYVVETSEKVVQRFILMTTDPGDLVLDPTCGSGTTAYVAERWGRRWITIDTSRVALALARARIMGARYAYYLKADSREGQLKEAEVTRTEPSTAPVHGDLRHGFVYERVPHITLKSIANNAEIDVIWEKYQTLMEPLRAALNQALGKNWQEWEIPRELGKHESDGSANKTATKTNTPESIAYKIESNADKIKLIANKIESKTDTIKSIAHKIESKTDTNELIEHTNESIEHTNDLIEHTNMPKSRSKAGKTGLPTEISAEKPSDIHARWWQLRIARQKEIDASIAALAEFEFLYDKPYEDKKKVRVAGPFTVESLSPHRVMTVGADDELIDPQQANKRDQQPDFAQMILEHLKTAGVQQAHKEDKITFTSIAGWPGTYICAEGRYTEADGKEKRAGIFVGPEFGTVARQDLVTAAREAGDANLDVLIACAFNYEAMASEFNKLGRVPVLKARMNANCTWARN